MTRRVVFFGRYNTPMPLRRYIFNTLTVVSLLLLLATAGFWVDSYWGYRNIAYLTESRRDFAISSHSLGLVSAGYTTQGYGDKIGWRSNRFSGEEFVSGPDDFSSYFLGFGYVLKRHRRFQSYGMSYGIVVPHWFLTLIFAILPAIWLFKWNKRRKLGPNACSSCGYDLTGNESGVCPECGVTAEDSASNPT